MPFIQHWREEGLYGSFEDKGRIPTPIRSNVLLLQGICNDFNPKSKGFELTPNRESMYKARNIALRRGNLVEF